MNRYLAWAMLFCFFFPAPVLAFHDHLSPEQVREAYLIGRDAGRRDAFFSKYVHAPAPANTGPDVQAIEFRTPYEQVAIRARENQWSNYLPPDAEKEYESHPREVIIRILIYETPTFDFSASDAQPDTAGFQFRVSQENRGIKYSTVTVEDAVPVGAGSLGSGGFGGIDIHLHFTASQFELDVPVTVEVLAPTSQTYSATFDLASLK